MANRGVGFFDSKGQFFRTPQEATLSDLANMLGRMGDGDSLAPGIAKILFDKRRDLEHIFRDHDDMLQGRATDAQSRADDAAKASNVTPINPAKSA
jgi:hypothetical protein